MVARARGRLAVHLEVPEEADHLELKLEPREEPAPVRLGRLEPLARHVHRVVGRAVERPVLGRQAEAAHHLADRVLEHRGDGAHAERGAHLHANQE